MNGDRITANGLVIQVQRIVPIKHVSLSCLVKKKDLLLEIGNRQGKLKEYQFLQGSLGLQSQEECMKKWNDAISSLDPSDDDVSLWETLNNFQQWNSQNPCRVTIYKDSKLHQENKSIQVLEGRKAPRTSSSSSLSIDGSLKSPRGNICSLPIETNCQIGVDASVGSDSPMTLSQSSVDHIPGIETSFGPGETVTEDNDVYTKTSSSSEGRPTSANEKRRRLSSIFRVGVFLTRSKKTKKPTPTSPEPDVDNQGSLSPPSRSVMKKQGRRMSRLEMNEPIEDVFADLKFDVLEKPTTKPASISSIASDDEDLIEDPDEIVMSTLEERRQSEQGPQHH